MGNSPTKEERRIYNRAVMNMGNSPPPKNKREKLDSAPFIPCEYNHLSHKEDLLQYLKNHEVIPDNPYDYFRRYHPNSGRPTLIGVLRCSILYQNTIKSCDAHFIDAPLERLSTQEWKDMYTMMQTEIVYSKRNFQKFRAVFENSDFLITFVKIEELVEWLERLQPLIFPFLQGEGEKDEKQDDEGEFFSHTPSCSPPPYSEGGNE